MVIYLVYLGGIISTPFGNIIAVLFNATVLSIGYKKGNVAETKYFFTRNAQNDIVSIYRSSDSKLIGTYEYDLLGIAISCFDVGYHIDDPLAWAGLACDFFDLIGPGLYIGEVVNTFKYARRSGALDAVVAISKTKFDELAGLVLKKGDDAIAGGAGIGFDLSKLSRSQQKAIESADNIINDHLKSSDLSAALGDLQGNPIEKFDGGYWNHAQEVKDAYTGLVRAEKTLAGSLQNPNLEPDVRAFIQGKYDSIISYMTTIEEMFAPYGGIN